MLCYVEAVDGLRFLPVDRRLYLRVQYCLNLLQTTHPSIDHAMLLHGEQLVTSTLTRGATKALHRFLCDTFLQPPPIRAPVSEPPHAPKTALLRAAVKHLLQRSTNPRGSAQAGVFICGLGSVVAGVEAAPGGGVVSEFGNDATPTVHLERQPGVYDPEAANALERDPGSPALPALSEEDPALEAPPDAKRCGVVAAARAAVAAREARAAAAAGASAAVGHRIESHRIASQRIA
jgi:hypothetical protein